MPIPAHLKQKLNKDPAEPTPDPQEQALERTPEAREPPPPEDTVEATTAPQKPTLFPNLQRNKMGDSDIRAELAELNQPTRMEPGVAKSEVPPVILEPGTKLGIYRIIGGKEMRAVFNLEGAGSLVGALRDIEDANNFCLYTVPPKGKGEIIAVSKALADAATLAHITGE